MYRKRKQITTLLACVAIGAVAACGGGSTSGSSQPSTPADDGYVAGNPTQFTGGASDIVWDEKRQLLYLSLRSAAGPNGNSIIALDPKTNSVIRSQFAGSEPNTLSISDDGQYLYAGMLGSASVQRFKLPELTPDLNIPLGQLAGTNAPFLPIDVQSVPGSPRSFAVSMGVNAFIQQTLLTAVYDDATARPATVSIECACSSLQWDATGSKLFAADNEDTGFSFYSLNAAPSGISIENSKIWTFSQFNSKIHYSKENSLLYSDDGTVLDPKTASKVATLPLTGSTAPDVAKNRIYTATLDGGFHQIVAYDAKTYQEVGKRRQFITDTGGADRLTRWGVNGLALTTGAAGSVLIFGGGGTSTFDAKIPVGSASQVLIPGSINRIVWDHTHSLLYASVSGTSSSSPNSIIAIDPNTSTIVKKKYIGNEPDAIAVSEDGTFLYVGLDNTGTIQRLKLPALDDDLSLPLGGDPFYGAYVAGDIKVSPNSPRTIAVTLLSPATVPSEVGGINIYDDATVRSHGVPVMNPKGMSDQPWYFHDLEWSSDGKSIYSSDLYGDLYTLTVQNDGAYAETAFRLTWPSFGHIHLDGDTGLVYHDSGRISNPQTGMPRGIYRLPQSNGGELLITEPSSNQMFVVTQSTTPGDSRSQLIAFDKTKFTPTKTYPIDITGVPWDLYKLGNAGFAVRSYAGIYIISPAQ